MMRKILFLTISLMLVAVGCTRQIDSENPLQSLPNPLSAPVNVDVLLNDRAVTLTWEMPGSAAISRFRIYMADTDVSDFTLRDSTTAYSLTIDGLAVNRIYFFQIAGVTLAGIEGNRSTPISTEIGLFSITIASGNDYTSSREVQIRVNSSISATHVILSEDSLFSNADYKPYTSSFDFTLSGGDGQKEVFAGFIFSDGTRSGKPISDKIILDTRAVIDSVFFAPYGQVFTSGDVITLGLDAGIFGPDGMELDGRAYVLLSRTDSVKLYDDGTSGDIIADDGIYMVDYYLTDDMVLLDTSLTGHFIDAAGNYASKSSDSIVAYVNLPPGAIILAGVLSEAETVSLTWSQSNATDFESYRIYRNNSVMADPPSQTLMIAYINDYNTTTFNDYLPETGTYHYVIYVYDCGGAKTGSNEVVITR